MKNNLPYALRKIVQTRRANLIGDAEMKPYIDIDARTCYPTIGANKSDDNDVILTFNCYPLSSMMSVPLSKAVELAEKIMWIANNQTKEEE
jgi:hypothetical protein